MNLFHIFRPGNGKGVSDLSKDIVARLEEKKALRSDLPFHIGRAKFLFLVASDVADVINERDVQTEQKLATAVKCLREYASIDFGRAVDVLKEIGEQA